MAGAEVVALMPWDVLLAVFVIVGIAGVVCGFGRAWSASAAAELRFGEVPQDAREAAYDRLVAAVVGEPGETDLAAFLGRLGAFERDVDLWLRDELPQQRASDVERGVIPDHVRRMHTFTAGPYAQSYPAFETDEREE